MNSPFEENHQKEGETLIKAGDVKSIVFSGGTYQVEVENTAGTSPPSDALLDVVELSPSLSGSVEPPNGHNSRSTDIRIFGENLSGTMAVELTMEDEVIPLIIVSTSLNEVVATVPGGLEAGAYVVRLTNSTGTTSGGTFTVTAGGGGGGGCGAALPGSPSPLPNFPFLLLTVFGLAALRWLRSAGVRTADGS